LRYASSKINVSKFLDVGNKILGNIYLIKIWPMKMLYFFKIGPIKLELYDNFLLKKIIDNFLHKV
jgi:hypothetical protein